MLNTINKSTGFSGFQLKTGHSPNVILPLTPMVPNADDVDNVKRTLVVLKQLNDDVLEACNNLLQAKVAQAEQAKKHHGTEVIHKVGDTVMLSTFHCCREYVQKDQKCVAKFMSRYNGPYYVTKSFPKKSVYTLHMPNAPELFPTFHSSLLTKHIPNNNIIFPGHVQQHLGTIITEDGEVE